MMDRLAAGSSRLVLGFCLATMTVTARAQELNNDAGQRKSSLVGRDQPQPPGMAAAQG